MGYPAVSSRSRSTAVVDRSSGIFRSPTVLHGGCNLIPKLAYINSEKLYLSFTWSVSAGLDLCPRRLKPLGVESDSRIGA